MNTPTFFLDTVTPFPSTAIAEKERQYSHWLKVAEACKVCRQTKDTKELLRILQLELLSKRRQIIIDRVYACFSAMRSDAEYSEFIEEFKKAKPFDQDDDAYYIPKLQSWTHAFGYIQTLDINPLPEIKRLMCYEYHHRNRYYLLQRAYTKFQTIRRNMEKREMYTWSPKKLPNNIYVNKYAY